MEVRLPVLKHWLKKTWIWYVIQKNKMQVGGGVKILKRTISFLVLYNVLGVNLTSFGNIAEYPPPPTLVNLLLRIPHSIRVRPGPQKP